MKCSVAILIQTTLFAVTVSKPLITADNYSPRDGDTVVIRCTVTDFTENIFVKQDGNNRGVCFGSTPCSTPASPYTVAKSGTNLVTFTIISFLETRDVGSWLVRYGAADDSDPIILSAYTESTTTPIPTTTLTPTTTTISSTTPSPTLKNYFIIGAFGILVILLIGGGVIYWKRNQKKISLQKKKHSVRGTRTHENTRGAQELQNK